MELCFAKIKKNVGKTGLKAISGIDFQSVIQIEMWVNNWICESGWSSGEKSDYIYLQIISVQIIFKEWWDYQRVTHGSIDKEETKTKDWVLGHSRNWVNKKNQQRREQEASEKEKCGVLEVKQEGVIKYSNYYKWG